MQIRSGGGPASFELVLMLAMALGLHVAILSVTHDYWAEVAGWLDNGDYLRIATAVQQRTWTCDPDCPRHAWGFPYAIAAVASGLRLSSIAALVSIGVAASFGALLLVRRLYGGWVAAALIATGFTWIQLAVLGGSEPLFLALLYGTFALARRGRVKTATTLAAFGAMVRPVGAIAIAAMAIDALRRKQIREVWTIGAIAAGLMAVYFVPIFLIARDPQVSVLGYREDWFSPLPIGVPLVSLTRDWISLLDTHPRAFPITAGWFLLAAAGLWQLWAQSPQKVEERERLFATIYVLFFFCATYGGAAYFLPRFLLPAAPIVLAGLEGWIPRSRPLLWALAAASGIVHAGSRTFFR